MLSWVHSSEAINDEAEFRRCLRALIQGNNILSRVRGFTPEQALLGKMSRLPASLTSDDSACSHALADSDLSEWVAFRKDLQRREQARIAFVQLITITRIAVHPCADHVLHANHLNLGIGLSTGGDSRQGAGVIEAVGMGPAK